MCIHVGVYACGCVYMCAAHTHSLSLSHTHTPTITIEQALARRNYLPSTIDLELFTSLATRDYSKFNPQNLANLLWALAVFRTQPKAFDPEEHASWCVFDCVHSCVDSMH